MKIAFSFQKLTKIALRFLFLFNNNKLSILPHLFQSTMTYFNIVLAVFSYSFKDVNVLPAVLFTFAYRLPNFSYFKLVLGLFEIRSEKLSTRTAVQYS